MVQAQGGIIIRSILVYSMAPNGGEKNPTELARETAIGLS